MPASSRAFFINIFYEIYLINDSFNLLDTETKNPINITITPAQTKFINGLTLAEIDKTSLGLCCALFFEDSLSFDAEIWIFPAVRFINWILSPPFFEV